MKSRWLPEELEAVSCDCCGSVETIRHYLRGDGLTVYECAGCGLAYLNPRPRSEFIYRFYGEDYFDGSSSERGDGGLKLCLAPSESNTIEVAWLTQRKLEVLQMSVGDLSGKKILEIGCATGDLMVLLKQKGANVFGLEISDFAAGVARERGLDVTTGMIEEYAKGSDDCFDVIMAFEVIEHVLSPARFLETAMRLLRKGGLLLLSTPNYSCARRNSSQWRGFTGSFEHLYFFTQKTLDMMCQQKGFALRYVESSIDIGRPNGDCRGLSRLMEQFNTFLYFVAELGWSGTIRAIRERDGMVYHSGIGHTLLVTFEKTGDSAVPGLSH